VSNRTDIANHRSLVLERATTAAGRRPGGKPVEV
jgi:hypothetical protein